MGEYAGHLSRRRFLALDVFSEIARTHADVRQ
jgi:hypothetical protein